MYINKKDPPKGGSRIRGQLSQLTRERGCELGVGDA